MIGFSSTTFVIQSSHQYRLDQGLQYRQGSPFARFTRPVRGTMSSEKKKKKGKGKGGDEVRAMEVDSDKPQASPTPAQPNDAGKAALEEWEAGQPLGKEAAEALCTSIGRKLVRCVAAVNQLPPARDFGYYNSFAEFKTAVSGSKKSKKNPAGDKGGSAASRLVNLIGKVIAHHSPNSDPPSFDVGKADVEEIFDSIVDFSDARLEDVDLLLDEMAGKAPSSAANKVVTGVGRGAKRGGVRGQPEDLGLPKPQLHFKDEIDNSNT
eukprot:3936800-Rhodomonas_salina.2